MLIDQSTLTSRLDFIQQLQQSPTPFGQQQVEFQGDVNFYDVHKVDLGFPCYRLANGRTQAAQREVAVVEGLGSEFFSADPDSAAALEKQESILLSMIKAGKDAQILEIMRTSPQSQALILDSSGYVINGNRRLCAMRLLFEQDSEAFVRFERIQVLFLPACSANDIDELEARLQWKPDGRSDYSWVDKAIVLRERQDRSKWSIEKMAQFYDMSKREVQLWIAMLDDAEDYLTTREWTGQYSKVIGKRYAFEELQKGRVKCGNDEPKKDFFTSVAYQMIDDADATGGRLYDSIPDALRYLDEIKKQLEVDFKGKSSSTDVKNLDILGDDLDSSYAQASSTIRDPKNGESVRNTVRDKIEEKRREERERRDSTYCLRQAKKAYAALENVYGGIDEDDVDTEGLQKLLENISRVCRDIEECLNGK